MPTLQYHSKFVRCRVAALAAMLPLASAVAESTGPGPQAFVADPAFGTSGATILDFADAYALEEVPIGMFPDQQGGYWVLGAHRPYSGSDRLAIGKLDADGQLDPTFGTGGKMTADVPGFLIMAATTDGQHIYVATMAGGNGADFAVACFNVDASPCAAFGTAGRVSVPFDAGGGNNDIPQRIVLRGNALYVSGDVGTDGINGAWNTATGVAKLDATTGQLDPLFGNLPGKAGRSVFNIDLVPNGAEYNSGLALSNDGSRLLLSGSTPDIDAATGRMLQDAFVLAVDPTTGQLDTGFADAGKRIASLPPGDNFGQIVPAQMLVRHNGHIVVVGDYRHDINGVVRPEVVLIELDADGAFHTGFGDGGIVHLLVGNGTEALDVAERPCSGRLVVGAMNNGLDPLAATNHQQSLIEFDSSGTRTTSAIVFTFPSEGSGTEPGSYPKSVLVDAANRTLILGWRNYALGSNVTDRDITLSRFVDDDAIFGNGFGGAYAD